MQAAWLFAGAEILHFSRGQENISNCQIIFGFAFFNCCWFCFLFDGGGLFLSVLLPSAANDMLVVDIS